MYAGLSCIIVFVCVFVCVVDLTELRPGTWLIKEQAFKSTQSRLALGNSRLLVLFLLYVVYVCLQLLSLVVFVFFTDMCNAMECSHAC